MKSLIDPNERHWRLYVHIVPKELSGYEFNKMYFGITVQDKVERRWGSNGCGYKKHYFWKAIQKYGWNNIFHYVFPVWMTLDEAKRMEHIFVQFFHTDDYIHGYNETPGGDYVSPKARAVTCTRIAQYNLDGSLIAVYKSIKEASDETGIPTGVINQYKQAKSSGGFMWRALKKDETPLRQIEPYSPLKADQKDHRLIRVYEAETAKYIKTMEVHEAYEEYGIHLKKSKYDHTVVSGCVFRLDGDDTPVTPIKEWCNYHPVYAYTKEGEFIGKYDSGKDALRALTPDMGDYGIPSRIYKNVYDNLYRGYRFTKEYYDKLPPLLKITGKGRPVIISDDNNVIIDISNTFEFLKEKYGFTQKDKKEIFESVGEPFKAYYIDQINIDDFTFEKKDLQFYYDELINIRSNRMIANR